MNVEVFRVVILVNVQTQRMTSVVNVHKDGLENSASYLRISVGHHHVLIRDYVIT